MSQPASSPELGDEVAAQRRARLHTRMAELGKRPLTGAEILALQAADDDGFPDNDELDAFLASPSTGCHLGYRHAVVMTSSSARSSQAATN
jgi:hypothetical protein